MDIKLQMTPVYVTDLSQRFPIDRGSTPTGSKCTVVTKQFHMSCTTPGSLSLSIHTIFQYGGSKCDGCCYIRNCGTMSIMGSSIRLYGRGMCCLFIELGCRGTFLSVPFPRVFLTISRQDRFLKSILSHLRITIF
jgi:hypothetical protein